MILQKLREARDVLDKSVGRENSWEELMGSVGDVVESLDEALALLDQMKPWPSEDTLLQVLWRNLRTATNGELVKQGIMTDNEMLSLDSTSASIRATYRFLIQHQAPQWTEDKEKLLAAYRKECEAANTHIKGFEPRLDVDGLWSDPILENEYFRSRAERVKLEGM